MDSQSQLNSFSESLAFRSMSFQVTTESVNVPLIGERRRVDPCTIVIFGASGDLTARKLIPALYHLFESGQLPTPFRVVGFARREKSHDSWREELRAALEQLSRTKSVDAAVWQRFAGNLFYCSGDFNDSAAYGRLKLLLEGFGDESLKQNLLLYLATGPSQFAVVAENVFQVGLLHKWEDGADHWQRLVVEKPFGRDLQSARLLNNDLTRHIRERQVLRIDHYLGKETVQNILMFRFSNAIFERLWQRETIDNVQITVSEKLGVGSRGGYYEEAGALRDMLQNHLLQVLSLVAMEPPVSLEAEAIRNEKVKLLQSIRPLRPEDVARQVVRGQYFAGAIGGDPRIGYRQEIKVRPDSNVETYVAVNLFVDNWRWSGVPFYLRTGKSLPLSASEVRIEFRPTPHVLFAAREEASMMPNVLTLRVQPNEGISLAFNGKVPGTNSALRQVQMQFNYTSEFGAYTPEAYERLLLEAMAGNATLFIRRDEVESAWKIADAIREGWGAKPLTNREFYSAGSWGPVAAEDLLARSGHAWHDPQPSV